jgi:RNA polymerase sigma-70 factor (ECF subfamily)
VFEELENCFSSSLKVEEEVEAKEVARLIEEFLNGLDKVNRVIFIKRYWFAESVKDIAKSTGMSAHTITVRLSRLREKLKLYLSESGVAV